MEKSYNKCMERDVFSVTRFALHSKNAPHARRYTPESNMKVATALLCLVLLVFFPSVSADASGANSNSCEAAPDTALLELPSPYSSWFEITCNGIRKAHFIGATEAYTWKETNTGQSYSFNAYGPISPSMSALERNTYEPHKYHFLRHAASQMAPAQTAGVNQLLSGVDKQYTDIRQLDVSTNTNVIYSFFVFLEQQEPEWIVACVNYSCGQSAQIEVSAAP